MHSRTIQRKSSKNGVKARKKQTQMECSVHKGPGHHLLVPSQYMGDGPLVKEIRRYGLAMQRKGGSILGFLPKLLWRNVLLGWHFTQKGKCGLGPFDACH